MEKMLFYTVAVLFTSIPNTRAVTVTTAVPAAVAVVAIPDNPSQAISAATAFCGYGSYPCLRLSLLQQQL
jgi:hypothetical protein